MAQGPRRITVYPDTAWIPDQPEFAAAEAADAREAAAASYLSCDDKTASCVPEGPMPQACFAARIQEYERVGACSGAEHKRASQTVERIFAEEFEKSKTSNNYRYIDPDIERKIMDTVKRQPERMIELLRILSPYEIIVILEAPYGPDIDVIFKNEDVIYKLKDIFDKGYVSPPNRSYERPGIRSDFITGQLSSAGVLLTKYREEFLAFLDRIGPHYLEIDRMLRDSRIGRRTEHDDIFSDEHLETFFTMSKSIESPAEITGLAALLLVPFSCGSRMTPAEVLGFLGARDIDGPMCMPEVQEPGSKAVEAFDTMSAIFGGDPLPQEIIDLIEMAPERILELASSFDPDDIRALATGRIKNAEDLEVILANRDLILKIKREYFAYGVLSADGTKTHSYESWARRLGRFPANIILTRYGNDFLKMYERIGANAFISLNIADRAGAPESDDETDRKARVFFSVIADIDSGDKSVDSDPRMSGRSVIASLSNALFNEGVGADDAEMMHSLTLDLVKMYGNRDLTCGSAGGMIYALNNLTWRPLSAVLPVVDFSKEEKALTAGIMLKNLIDHRAFINRNRELFLKIIEKAHGWAVNSHSKCYYIFLTNEIVFFLNHLMEDYVENHGEVVLELVQHNSLTQTAVVLDWISNMPVTPLVMAYARKVENGDLGVIHFLPYLESIGCPASRLEDMEGSLSLDELLTDFRTGEDLREVSLKRGKTYEGLVRALENAGRSDGVDRLIEMLKFDRLENELRGLGFLDRAKKLWNFGNSIDPKFSQMLVQRYIADEILKPGVLSGILKNWHNPKNGMVDVTQNNIADINVLLSLMVNLKDRKEAKTVIDRELAAVFPNYTPQADCNAAVTWLASMLDVEEIEIKKIRDMGLLGDYIELQSKMNDLFNQAAGRYLDNKFAEIDLMKILGDAGTSGMILDVKKLDMMRLNINVRDKKAGDEFIGRAGSAFLESHPVGIGNLPALLDFGRAWSAQQESGIEEDALGLYQESGQFAFMEVADFVKNRIDAAGESKARKELAAANIDLNKLVDELETRGFPIREQNDVSKAFDRILTNPVYVWRRGVQKIGGGEGLGGAAAGVKAVQNPWTPRDGVEVQDLLIDGRERARVIRCGRGKVKVKVLANRSGLVDTEAFTRELGGRYVFSAPMSMTTGNRKLTEIAFQDGVQMNWLLTPKGKDGLLIVGQNGDPKIFDKREIVLGDLITEEDLAVPGIRDACNGWLKGKSYGGPCSPGILKEKIHPFRRFRDKSFFLKILKAKRLSLLCGMLLINGKESHHLNDGPASRRFFLEFEDGRFGVANTSEDMSTGDLTDMLLAMGGVKRAIYMDTGMFDKATYRDGNGADHLMGHPDSVESTNRVVIYSD